MEALLQGVLFGLGLTVLVGPIFFVLIQTGIEEGFRAGIKVGLGIWMSDLIYILLCYLGLSYVIEIAKWNNFEFYMGTIGGVILLAVGIKGLMSKQVKFENGQAVAKQTSNLGLWLKGFLINSINPFTFLFWITVMTTAVLKDELNQKDVFIFFFAILMTVIITDTLKVYLAKWIREKMNDQYLIWLRRGGGIVFMLFGIALIIRVL